MNPPNDKDPEKLIPKADMPSEPPAFLGHIINNTTDSTLERLEQRYKYTLMTQIDNILKSLETHAKIIINLTENAWREERLNWSDVGDIHKFINDVTRLKTYVEVFESLFPEDDAYSKVKKSYHEKLTELEEQTKSLMYFMVRIANKGTLETD